MLPDIKGQCLGGGVGPGGGGGSRSKSRIFRICLYLRKNTSRGYTCLSVHNFKYHDICMFKCIRVCMQI